VDIRHVAGAENSVADALSRPAVAAVAPACSTQIDYTQMAEDQLTCQATQALAASNTLLVVRMDYKGASLLCDVSTGPPRPLVPAAWQKQVFLSIHNRPIQVAGQPGGWSVAVLYGVVVPPWSQTGVGSVLAVHVASLMVLCPRRWRASPYQNRGFPMCTWTLWAHSRCQHVGTRIC
jgi:hypothetical protein